MANNLTDEIKLLFRTAINKDDVKEVSKNIKSALENAVITFDEAEIKKEIVPVIQMLQKIFEKAEMKFDTEKLLAMPSREALQKIASISVDKFQAAFDRALAKSGGVTIDFGDADLSSLTASLGRVEKDLERVANKVANTTKKSVSDIEESIKRLNKVETKTINTKKPIEGSDKTVTIKEKIETNTLDTTAESIEKLFSDISTGYKTSADVLKKSYNKYKQSVDKNDPWEIQYQHMVEYVARYESLSTRVKNNIKDQPEFQQLYDSLAPKAGMARESLQDLVGLSRGNEFSEYKNQPWARESTLKKVEQALRNGITVKDGGNAVRDDNPSDGDSTLSWRDNDGDEKKLNTKVPLAEAEIKVDAEEKSLELARQKRIEEEKAAEAAKNAAEEVAQAVAEPVFTELERQIIEAVEEAKSKTLRKWENTDSDTKERYINEALKSRVTLNPSMNKDDKSDLLFDVVDFSDGDREISEVADNFKPWVVSVEEEFDKADAEIQELVRRLAKIDDETSDEAWEISEQILERNELLGELINQDTGGGWTKLKDKLAGKTPDAPSDIKTEAAFHQQNTEAIKEETKAEKELHEAKTQVVDVDDDSEAIAKENGALQDKLELLRDIADQYGNNITQKSRDRYEELNQKDMDTGLTAKEEDRYYELEEQITEADGALEEFGQTYDKIILRLANGKKVEILPDDKGLRSLYKFADGYGEEYNGVEIEDVVYQRVQKETAAHQGNTSAIIAETNAEQELNDAKNQQAKIEQSDNDGTEIAEEKAKTEVLKQENDALKENINLKAQANKQEAAALTDAGVEHKTASVQDSTKSTSGVGGKDSIQTEELRNLLSAITYNVKVVQDVESTEDDKIAIDTDALKSVLDNIIYNVKITHDDNDKQANRIAIDEGVLESTLKRVFADVLSPQTEQNDSEPKNEPWAREDTLSNTIKGVLDQIQTNTSKIGAVPQTPANDSDSILSQISKNVLEINGKIVKGTKAQNKDAAKTQKVPAGRDAQILAERIATQRLSLAKFKTELETSGRMTEDVAKKIRGLAISLGMVKDSKGLTKWGEKFKQQKLNVGITDIENKEEQQIEKDALKEKENRIKTLNKLYQEYGVLVERAAAAEGHFKEQLQDEIRDKDAEIWALRDSFDDITPEMFAVFDEAFERGKKIESTKQYEALSKRSDADEIARLKNIEGLEKEIGKLRANADAATNAGVKSALEAEIKLREELIALQKQGLVMDADAETYYRQKFANDTKRAKQNATQETKERKTAFNDAKRLAQREAMLGKTGSAVGRAETTWLSAAGIDGDLPAGFLAEIDEYYNKLDALRKKHQELKNSEMISDAQKKELIEQTMSVNKMTEEIGELVSEYQRLSGDNSTVIGTNTLGTDAGLSAYEQQLKQTVMTATNGKAQIKNFDAATKTLTYTVKTGKNEFTEYTAAVRRADGALVSVQGATKRTETFIEATTRKMKELTSYFSGMAVFNQVGQELRRGIQYVKEIDLALTELRKVTDETEETYDRFLETAAKTADKVGSTIQKVVSSTADWARLGYSMKEAAEFAESTQILMNVSEFTDVSQATDTLISAVQAFGYTAETSMDVVDLLNTIGKQNCRCA